MAGKARHLGGRAGCRFPEAGVTECSTEPPLSRGSRQGAGFEVLGLDLARFESGDLPASRVSLLGSEISLVSLSHLNCHSCSHERPRSRSKLPWM